MCSHDWGKKYSQNLNNEQSWIFGCQKMQKI